MDGVVDGISVSRAKSRDIQFIGPVAGACSCIPLPTRTAVAVARGVFLWLCR